MDINETTAVDTVETTEEVTFTEAQKAAIAQMLQAEADRRTNQALAKQKKEYEKKLSLATLDGAEREKAEQANIISELREQLKEFQLEAAKSELKSVLSARGLDAQFCDMLAISEEPEHNQRVIDSFDKLFKAAVKAEVEKRLAASGGTPKGNGTNLPEQMTKDEFRKLPLSAQARLAKESPELYKKLTTM